MPFSRLAAFLFLGQSPPERAVAGLSGERSLGGGAMRSP